MGAGRHSHTEAGDRDLEIELTGKKLPHALFRAYHVYGSGGIVRILHRHYDLGHINKSLQSDGVGAVQRSGQVIHGFINAVDAGFLHDLNRLFRPVGSGQN